MDHPLTGQQITDNDHAAGAGDLDAAGRPPVNAKLAVGGRPGATGRLRRVLERVGTADARANAGQQRDLLAGGRDRAADARDVQAQARDALSDKLREIAGQARVSTGRDVIARAAMDRERAFEDRALAAEHRARAALDREHAAHDRLQSMRDRAAIAEEQLTDANEVAGVLARAVGLAALTREVDRAHRTNSTLTVVYVDASDDLPGIGGRAVDTGDATWRDVAGELLNTVRSYDLIIAVGAEAFACVLSGAAIGSALARFTAIERTVAATGAVLSVGYAELAANDTADTLIDAAVADAPSTRLRTDHGGSPKRTLRTVSANANGRHPR